MRTRLLALLLLLAPMLGLAQVSGFDHAISPAAPRAQEQISVLITPKDGNFDQFAGVQFLIKKDQQPALPFRPNGANGSYSFQLAKPGNYTLSLCTGTCSGSNQLYQIPIQIDASLSLDQSLRNLVQDPYRTLRNEPIETPRANSLPVPDETMTGTEAFSIIYLLQQLANLLAYAAGAIAVLLIVAAGLRMVTSFGDPDALAASKRGVSGVAIGLLIISGSYFIVRSVVQLAFVGDSIPNPDAVSMACEGEVAGILAEAEQPLKSAEGTLAEYDAALAQMSQWRGYADTLQTNFSRASWMKNEPTALSDLQAKVNQMGQTYSTALSEIELIRAQIEGLRQTHATTQAECELFDREALLVSRANYVKDTITQSDVAQNAAALEPTIEDARQSILTTFEQIVGGDCPSDRKKSSDGILFKVSGGEKIYSCADDWDADGRGNETEFNEAGDTSVLLDPLG